MCYYYVINCYVIIIILSIYVICCHQ